MTAKSLLQAGIRILGFYLIYATIYKVAVVLYIWLSSTGPTSADLMALKPIAVQLAIQFLAGFTILWFASNISNFLMRGDDDAIALPKHEIVEVALIIIGIVRIITAFPNFDRIFILGDWSLGGPSMIVMVIYIAFGVVMIWKARAIASFILKINLPKEHTI